jgi:hypothetical protein
MAKMTSDAEGGGGGGIGRDRDYGGQLEAGGAGGAGDLAGGEESRTTTGGMVKNFSPEVIYRALLAQKLFTNFMSSGEASAAPAWNCHIQLQAETEGSGSIKTLNAEQLKEARRLHRNMRKRRRYHANKVHNKPVEAIKNLECGGTGTHMNKRRKPDG